MQLSSGLSFLCAGIMSMHHHAQILLIVIYCYNNALITSRGRKTGFKHLDTAGCGVVRLRSGPWGLLFNLPLSQLSQLGDGNNYPAQDSYASNSKLCLLANTLTGNGALTTPCQSMRQAQEPTEPVFSGPLRRHPTAQKRKAHF